MYGKHFESMYDGSMYGAGINVFAVWGYVISHARNGTVELNPRKLSDTLGGPIEDIQAAIEFLMKPDSESRHKEHDGRRLLKDGEFQYSIPSWSNYQTLRNEEARREYNRVKQREYREKQRATAEERKYDEIYGREGKTAADAWLDKRQSEKEKTKRKPKPPEDAGNGT